MKKIKSGLFFAASLLLMQTNLTQAKNLKAYLGISEFFIPAQSAYVETYLNLSSNSIIYALNGNGKYQASVAINITFSKNDSISAYQKYNLLSAEYDDTLSRKPNFIDVQRFMLAKGDYNFDLKISDNNNINKPFEYQQIVNVNIDGNKTSFSSIELVDNYKKATQIGALTKSGYDFVPYVSSYYPDNISDITFYTELYAIDKQIPLGETFVINCYIESFENGMKVTDYFRFTRNKSASIVPLLSSFDLSKLPSGNYNLVIEARNKENLIVADQKTFFQRNNASVQASNVYDLASLDVTNSFVSKISVDSFPEFIRWLKPTSNRIEVEYADNVIKSRDTSAMRQFFLAFWQKRNAIEPQKEWTIYKENVYWVNRNFSAATRSRDGYRTERGRVYLQYGKPDSRIAYDRDATAYPYEIWQYYKSGVRANRRFIFYNTDLSSNDYRLLHSDAIGEVKDSRWELRLQGRAPSSMERNARSFDIEKASDSYGQNAKDIFDISR